LEFHDRPPAGDDRAIIGLVELASGRFEPLAETRAWNLQQGTMLHWLPTDPDHYITYNDRQGDRYVAVLLDVHTGRKRILPRPISALSHNGGMALSLNYARLRSRRPVVGYAGLPDRFADQPHPAEDGIFRLDVETGEAEMAVSYQAAYRFLGCPHEMHAHNMWFNHTVFSPDDSRFCFLSRWNQKVGTIAQTVMLSADVDGSELRVVMEEGASHFDWRTPDELWVWARAEEGAHYYAVNERTGKREIVGRETLTRNGHCSFSRDGQWLLTDTGPDENHDQTLLLWNVVEERRVDLGKFAAPLPFRGEIRCDLHPRWSRDERHICFDSIHEGTRQVYVMDISGIVCPSSTPPFTALDKQTQADIRTARGG
jgi:hypothetical protein